MTIALILATIAMLPVMIGVFVAAVVGRGDRED